ncbi:pLS20_p028 family conjugation system transmembrane protein [Bacillus thuringiensis]|uniref:pLS20_p028 family conjugation system transmembrane protein n=1 Tax=Bacillus thuringiensis TaxID=1428 RepID=UPI003CEB4ACB
MKDEQILQILQDFNNYLIEAGIWNHGIRSIGWLIILGLSSLVDALQNVTDTILGVKAFYNSDGIIKFVETIRPGLWILLALSLLYVGYMFIMNKKMNRTQVVMNIFVSMSVLILLSAGMTKVDKFTDDAIAVVEQKQNGSMSEKIIKTNLIDVAQLDATGWKDPNLKEPNKIAEKNIRNIDITQKIDGDFEISKDKKISDDGKKILESRINTLGDGTQVLGELNEGWFNFFPDNYYRWGWNFWTMFATLLVTGLTLLLVSIKLLRLFYELGFNYILASILAPADVANGQKLKAVLTNILNTFMVVIMIFISLKVYMLGTEYLTEKTNGVVYVLGLIAFSLAVIDGPNMCERIFGIDAGLKSGWGLLAGGLAAAKGMTSAAKGIGKGLAATGSALATGGASAAGMISGLRSGNKGNGQDDDKESLQDQMKKEDQKNKDLNQNDKKNEDGTEEESLQGQMEQDAKNQGEDKNDASLQEQMDAASKQAAASTEQQGTGNGTASGDSKNNTSLNGVDTSKVQDGPQDANKTAGTGASGTGTQGAGGSGTATVQQQGTGTTGTATVQQGTGTTGTTTVQQQGAGGSGTATVQQQGTGTTGTTTVQQQGTGTTGTTTVQQQGTGTTGTTTVQQQGTGTTGTTTVQQGASGSEGTTVVQQGSGSPGGTTVVQQGSGNSGTPTVVQQGSGNSGTPTVVQQGSGSPGGTTVVQQGSGSPGGTTVVQQGSGSPGGTTVVQQGSGSSGGTTVVQRGPANGGATQVVQQTQNNSETTVIKQNSNNGETRTIGEFFADRMKNTKFAQRTQKAYELGRNSGRSWRDIANKKKEENEE